jgi:nucleotide-binding universal stress UspA family protein
MHRILVVANETLAGRRLLEEIVRRVDDQEAQVHVVCPALNSRLRHWLSDEDGAREAAEARLAASLATLSELGIDATGATGDADPVQAIHDALCSFKADELVVSTHPPGRSNWLEKDVTERAKCFGLPLTHVVVDLEAEVRARTAA